MCKCWHVCILLLLFVFYIFLILFYLFYLFYFLYVCVSIMVCKCWHAFHFFLFIDRYDHIVCFFESSMSNYQVLLTFVHEYIICYVFLLVNAPLPLIDGGGRSRADIHIIWRIHVQCKQHLIFIPTNFKQIKHYGQISRIVHIIQ